LQLGSGPVRLDDWLRGRGHPWTPPDGRGEAVKPLRRLQLQILTQDRIDGWVGFSAFPHVAQPEDWNAAA
ncbi:MAG: hypothetical protein V3S57_05155, partial [candidate division NC10 bacterium]